MSKVATTTPVERLAPSGSPKPPERNHRRLWLATLVVVLLASGLGVWLKLRAPSDALALRQSVFKIRNYAQAPDFASPWKVTAGMSSYGTGFYIGKNRILTNAHVVTNGHFLTVQRADGQNVAAKAVFIAHDADLAILTPEDPHFFDDLDPLAFAPGLPQLRSPVFTIGFPLGGEKVSITEGVVSRVDYRLYVHDGAHRHLLVQVDSAINPGNSGGPVVQGDRVVGVAFQANLTAQRTGYVIPTPVIARFLDDIADGRYDGHPEDGLEVQEEALANPSTAEFYGLSQHHQGVIVKHLSRFSPFAGHLARGDVLLAVDGHDIDTNGRVLFMGERVDFKVYYDLRQPGETVRFTILRAGKTFDVPVKLVGQGDHYTQARIYPDRPQYLVYGGLVFAPLTRNYLETWGDDWYEYAPVQLRYLHRLWEFVPDFAAATTPVALVTRLPHSVNAYIDIPSGAIARSVNGTPVRSLAHMRKLLSEATGPYVVVEFWDSGRLAVLDREAALAANDEIATTYRITGTSLVIGKSRDLFVGPPAPKVRPPALKKETP